MSTFNYESDPDTADIEEENLILLLLFDCFIDISRMDRLCIVSG